MKPRSVGTPVLTLKSIIKSYPQGTLRLVLHNILKFQGIIISLVNDLIGTICTRGLLFAMPGVLKICKIDTRIHINWLILFLERIFLANSRLKIWRDFAIEIR